jgi:hypothetical protein
MKLNELYAIAKKELAGLSLLENSDFRLEQAEFNKDEKVWVIVVSYLVENVNKPIKSTWSPLVTNSEYPFHRIYKKVKINETNEVIGFYMFNPEQ